MNVQKCRNIMNNLLISLFCILAATHSAEAQDPADGWMAYAVGAVPSGVERITRLEMKWKVSNDPEPSRAFFSPWFGMDPSDNLNLIQPVNPWLGDGWAFYTEYFQWQPVRNSNSEQFGVNSGDELHGSLVYLKDTDSYNLTQTNTATGQTSQQIVRCQDGKKYTVPYVVYEKTWRCSAYPSDGVVTFTDIKVECDNTDCTSKVDWSAEVKDPNCNMEAHIDSSTQIRITWDTSLASKYDNVTMDALFEMNLNRGGKRKAWETAIMNSKDL